MRILLPMMLLLTGCPPSAGILPPPQDSPVDSGQEGEDTAPEIISFQWPVLVLNEFMASNQGAVADAQGGWGDWLEIYNPNDEAVDLDGWSLTDDPEATDRHALEQISVEGHGWLVLWADSDPEEGPDHLDFSLSSEGEGLALFAPDGEPVDALLFGRQAADVAAARVQDGGRDWGLVATPTPGAANGAPAETPVTWSPERLPQPPDPCGLTSDLASPHFLEGDTVDVHLACGGPLDLEAALLSPVVVPAGAQVDGVRVTWATGPSDGGRVDMVFGLTSGISGQVPLGESLTVWVADDPSNPDNVPVDPVTYEEEWGLPVFHVEADGDISGEYVGASVTFGGRTLPASIKVRGASSSWYSKPSYTLEFNETELDVPSWGVTRDHILLVSTFDDNSYVRQKLVYDQWAAMAEFWGQPRLTPRTFFAVMYLDGAYQGLYLALDRIDNEFLDQMGFDRESNLYKAVNHDANFYSTNASGYTKTTLHDGYTKEEGLPEDDWADLDALVAFTSASDAQPLVDGISGFVDLEEFMDWYLLVAYSCAADSAGKNSYLAREPDQTLFRYAPWDFNHSWGQDWRTFRVPATDIYDYSWNNKVFWAIQEVPETDATMWDRFDAMSAAGGPFDPEWIRQTVDAYYDLIDASARRDWATWESAYRSYGGWAWYRDSMGDWTDYDGEREYLYQWLEERAGTFGGP